MNRQAKSAIKSLVLTLRHKLEDDIAIQLKRYGFAGERWLPLERLPHVQRDDRATIDHYRLKAALEQHLRRIGAEPAEATGKQWAEAVDWFVREVAFTHLNRLVALKCLEVRGLTPEIITVRDAYGGRARAHHDYRNVHPDEARGADDALPAGIRHVCQEVYAEFRFLFDVGDPATGRQPPTNSILWPDYPVLKECIGLINGLDAAAGVGHKGTENAEAHASGSSLPSAADSLWAEDEIIGWIYQFYNAEQKEAIRKQGRPRRPAEVAVINQFFTPRWIVKFLVDNTLGRLWLEMHPDSERVRQKCDYLVPEPAEAEPQRHRDTEAPEFALDPDSPINDPKAPPRRAGKRPQDLRLIDPACGTMHFGHYAFEVFQEIYRDSREHGWVTGRDALPDEEIPAAILRHNLYGVDIDLRAVQLAGLSLFIKAKSANPSSHIAHVNLVVADAVLPADGARQQFLDRYHDDKVVQDAVRQVLDEMANVAEVGSLLRVEERLRDLLSKAGHEAVQDWDARRQRELPASEPAVRQLSLAETDGAVPEQWGAHYTLVRLLDDLRAFAAEALQTHDLNAQLFAQEAEKTVHLLDVFLNDYDTVVMNPPYGGTTSTAKGYLQRAYPLTKNDLYAAFLERALDLLKASGFAGAITSRTFLNLDSFRPLREQVLLKVLQPVAALDLGFGILDDAFVETVATALRADTQHSGEQAVFFRLKTSDDQRQAAFETARERLTDCAVREPVFVVPLADFQLVPGSPFAYWASRSLRERFTDLPLLQPAYGQVKQGLATADDSRFVRQRWEVSPDAVGEGQKWVLFAKGGDYCKHYYDLDLVLDWADDGAAIKSFSRAVVRNESFYFREGLNYPLVTVKGFNVRYLPPGAVFGHKGPPVFPNSRNQEDFWFGLGWLNSKLTQAFLLILTPSRSFEVGHVSRLPFAQPDRERAMHLAGLARMAHALKAEWNTGNETSARFSTPWLLQVQHGVILADFPDIHALQPQSPLSNLLHTLLNHVRVVEQAADTRLQALQTQIDDAVFDLYEISANDRDLIERELGERPPELVWPQMEGKSDGEKRREHVRRLLSYFLLQALQEKRDGILPLTAGTGQPTALDEIRRRLEAEFGEAAAFHMEGEIKQVLGRDIADWLDREFFKWHVKLYKSRPVVWHLASPGNHFACFLHLHNLDRDTLRKVQTLYLWPRRRSAESELDAAKAAQSPRRIEAAETVLDDLAEFEKRLLAVIQAQVACDIPDWAEGPFREGVYDPVLDDGVKVNIMPLQEAGLLRYGKVV